MKKYIILGLLLVLSGCQYTEIPVWQNDNKVREEIFFKCMQALPAGPQSTKYNDWDEVVSECGNQAYYMSNRCVKNCS